MPKAFGSPTTVTGMTTWNTTRESLPMVIKNKQQSTSRSTQQHTIMPASPLGSRISVRMRPGRPSLWCRGGCVPCHGECVLQQIRCGRDGLVKRGGTAAIILDLEDEDEQTLFAVVVDAKISEDTQTRLNAMFLALFFRFSHNQTTYFYQTRRHIKLNIWVVSAQIFPLSISTSAASCKVCYILEQLPRQGGRKPWSSETLQILVNLRFVIERKKTKGRYFLNF
jgi:hypothetical protein